MDYSYDKVPQEVAESLDMARNAHRAMTAGTSNCSISADDSASSGGPNTTTF